jgi:uncharacterized membrane protein YeaQ/YmgE (transglycosylase-associated protein family)
MTIQWVLRTFLVGLVIGAVARFLLPGKDTMGWVATSLFGIAGSVAGGYLTQVLMHHNTDPYGFQPANFVGSVVGAMVLLGIWRVFRPSK